MKSSAGLIASVILGGLIALVGIWLLVDGAACASVASTLSSGGFGGVLGATCSTYEVGGGLALLFAVIIITVGVLASRKGNRRRR
jgi:hypothetical protein